MLRWSDPTAGAFQMTVIYDVHNYTLLKEHNEHQQICNRDRQFVAVYIAVMCAYTCTHMGASMHARMSHATRHPGT